jgi:hypothetical protein
MPGPKRRARVIRRYVTWPPARPCALCGAALLRGCAGVPHALRASARHPWLAAPLQRAALRAGGVRGSGTSSAARSSPLTRCRARPLNACGVEADREHALRLSERSKAKQKRSAGEATSEATARAKRAAWSLWRVARCCRFRIAPCSACQCQAGCAGRFASIDRPARGAGRNSPTAITPDRGAHRSTRHVPPQTPPHHHVAR